MLEAVKTIVQSAPNDIEILAAAQTILEKYYKRVDPENWAECAGVELSYMRRTSGKQLDF